MSKIEILKSSKNNIDIVFNQCEEYRTQLIKYCCQYSHCDYEDACDCVQSAYASLYENLVNGVKINSHKAWLYKVTINNSKKTIKDKIKRNEYDFFDNEEKDKILENTLQYNPDYVDNMITDNEIEKQAIKIITSLNEEDKNLYLEYYCKNKKLEEIAEDIKISPQALKKRHQRLKEKIRKKAKEFEKI